ncbi:hypothetical protein VTK73DRAFT_125 [Phialemonium thermophilum]|uniref:Cytochrome c oxidase subunit IV n=1 Tax=Phialemonium thermophilum TaxID=223376 RepID=A0ABR3Y522_9PEZI
MLRTSATTTLLRSSLTRAFCGPSTLFVSHRAASTHAISKPTLANIEKRWESLPLQEQAELWMALRDRMKENWADLTLHEKRAAYWIAFGPHGPRAVPPPDENKKVFFYTLAALGVSFALFAGIRAFAGPAPHTMTKEWQEASNEYLKGQKADPFTGISSEGYSGKGMVQSPPKSN